MSEARKVIVLNTNAVSLMTAFDHTKEKYAGAMKKLSDTPEESLEEQRERFITRKFGETIDKDD